MNIEEIRARLARAKENVERDPWYVSTRVYIADVEELLEEVDRLTDELAQLNELYTELGAKFEHSCASGYATQKQLEAAVEDLRNFPGVAPCHVCKSGLVGGTDKCKLVDRSCFEWRGRKEQNDD